MGAFIDITGQRFGRLTAVSLAAKNRSGKIVWKCHCDCGTETLAPTHHLRNGQRVSCGCAKRAGNQIKKKAPKHGHYVGGKTTPTARIWGGMLSRCRNQNEPAYVYYGARGITVCKRWLSFENFLADMGERPAGKSIDRIDNNGNYEPSNCRWATDIEQHRNRSDNVRITFNGETLTLAGWEERLGTSHGLVRGRLKWGWSPEEALTRPVMTPSEAAVAANKARWDLSPDHAPAVYCYSKMQEENP